MRCCVHSYRKLAVVLLAATGVVGLTARAILAQSSPPGPAASTQDEPIKRTVLFRGDLEGAPGKEIVVFVADLAPGAVGSKHYHPGPEFFYVLEGTLAHEPEGGSPHIMKTGAFGSNPNKGIHVIRNPSTTERAGYRFPCCGETPVDRQFSQVAPTPLGPAISASGTKLRLGLSRRLWGLSGHRSASSIYEYTP